MRVSAAAVLFSVGVAASAPVSAQLTPRTTNLKTAPCELTIRPEVQPRVSCYRLTVPRRYDDRSRGTYELAVFVRRAETPVPGRAPVLWLHGGPGSGVGARALNTDYPFFPGADVVYFASRGSYPSQPQPCRDLDQKQALALVGKLSFAERRARYLAPHLECRRRLDALNIQTDEFGTSLNTEDIERLRRALGVEQWNVWANSYGTGSAYDLLFRYPRSVRAALLSSPISLIATGAIFLRRDAKYIKRLAEYCRVDAACAVAFPDLQASVARARSSLVGQPIVTRPFPAPFDSADVVLDETLFDTVLSELINNAPSLPKIPRFIRAVLERDVTHIAEITRPLGARLGGLNVFGHTAFKCRDLPQFSPDPLVEVRPACPTWGLRGPPIRVPRRVQTPVLLLTGELDNNTPPEHGAAAQRLMGRRARHVNIPTVSHGPYGYNACAREIAHAFFERPEAPLDTSCLTTIPPLRFDLARAGS